MLPICFRWVYSVARRKKKKKLKPCSHYIETTQMTWGANQLTGCYNMGTLFVIDDDDYEDDDQLFWRNGWPTKGFKPYFSRDYSERLSTLQTSKSAGFEPAGNLSLGFFKWRRVAVITTALQCYVKRLIC